MLPRHVKITGLALVGLSLLLSACQTLAIPHTPQTPLPLAAALTAKDPTTWVQAEYGQPETLDPALDYESAGNAILSRLYDTLITYQKDSPVDFIPALALEVPSRENGGISQDGLTYTFKIRPGVKFQDGSELTPADVAYTFQRGILQGGLGSPQWLFTEALYGAGVDDIAVVVDPEKPPYDDAEVLARYSASHLRQICADLTGRMIVSDPAAGTVSFHLKQPWGPFLPAFLGSWGSVTSKKWISANGGWDGDCATWQQYYGITSEQSLKTSLGKSAMGTGPFKLESWTPDEEIILVANETYWRGEPAQVKKVILKNVEEFSTRLSMLQAGDADYIAVNSDQWPIVDKLVGEVCDYSTQQCHPSETPGQPLRRWDNFVTGSRTDVFFNFRVNPEGNKYIGSGKLDGNGIPPDFFSDIHIRRAFEYCFNYEAYREEALQGEGTRSKTVMLPGMLGYDDNAPFYTYDLQKCEAEFKASTWKAEDGRSLWDVGFRMTASYNTGSTARQIIGQILQQNIARVNPRFLIEVAGMPWAAFLRAQAAKQLPIYFSGWMMDIYDTHNWVAPYTTGVYGSRQNLPKELQDRYRQIYSRAVVETDPARRAEIYKEFNQLFYDHATAIILYQPNGRRYLPRYVSSWYYNPVEPGEINWYSISKN